MGRLNGRLQKPERKDISGERVDAIIHRIVGSGDDGPVDTGRAIAVIPGLNAPRVVKSLDETYEEFCARIDKLSLQAKGLDEMSDDALQAAIDALQAIILEPNCEGKIAAQRLGSGMEH
jgi:hypothetical protein